MAKVIIFDEKQTQKDFFLTIAARSNNWRAGQFYKKISADNRQDATTQLPIPYSPFPPLGFELKEAKNGREAVIIWDEWEPHLIWIELRMPVTDG